jgi:hypothetical protein
MCMKQLLILCFVFLYNLSYSQPAPRINYLKNVNDIAGVLEVNYKPSEDSVNKACWEGCVFIKFDISEGKTFKNFSFTDTAPEFILLALHSAFNKMNASGALSQLKTSGRKTYILPFQIDYRGGCYPPGEANDYLTTPKPSADVLKSYAAKQIDYNQFQKSINNITNFTNGKVEAVECILLAPHIIIRGGY